MAKFDLSKSKEGINIISINKDEIKNINIELLKASTSNFYIVEQNKTEMEALKQSIKEVGVLQPLIVRSIDSKYEIISGHRRFKACKDLNFKTVPCIIKNINDNDEFMLTLILSNLQRVKTDIEIAEEIKVLKETYSNMIKKGYMKLEGRLNELIGEIYDKTATHIWRLESLNNLTPKMKSLIINKVLPTTVVGVFANLSEEQQGQIFEILEEKDFNVSLKEAEFIKKQVKNENLESKPVDYNNYIKKADNSIKKLCGKIDYKKADKESVLLLRDRLNGLLEEIEKGMS